MANPTDRKYTKDHTWAKVSGDTAEIGITNYAQQQLKEIVFVDLPSTGKVKQGKAAGGIESVKSVSDVKSPVSGEIISVNDALNSNPGLLNKDPYKNWVCKVKLSDPKELDKLLDAKTYEGKYK